VDCLSRPKAQSQRNTQLVTSKFCWVVVSVARRLNLKGIKFSALCGNQIELSQSPEGSISKESNHWMVRIIWTKVSVARRLNLKGILSEWKQSWFVKMSQSPEGSISKEFLYWNHLFS